MSADSIVCPYCRTPIVDGGDPPKVFCSGCGTPHHSDCYEENGGCTIFGCTAAPPDEPKVHIGASEAHSVPSTFDAPPIASAGRVLALDPSEPPPPPSPIYHEPSSPAKSRTTFILLGVLLGFFGAHSFYAGYRKRGFTQLAVSLCTLGIAALGVWIWAVIDICTISQDHAGMHFRD